MGPDDASPSGNYTNINIATWIGPPPIHIVHVHPNHQMDLLEVGDRPCGERGGARSAQSRKQHGRQYPDNRNDDEKLDECEPDLLPIRRHGYVESSRFTLHERNLRTRFTPSEIENLLYVKPRLY